MINTMMLITKKTTCKTSVKFSIVQMPKDTVNNAINVFSISSKLIIKATYKNIFALTPERLNHLEGHKLLMFFFIPKVKTFASI